MLAGVVIARPGEPTLDRCLATVRPHVDELVVLEGWVDQIGYAAARNRALDLVDDRHTWVFWLDADDALVRGGRLLRRLCRWAPARTIAFGIAYQGIPGHPAASKMLLVRRDAGWTWHGRAQERLEPVCRGDVAVIRPDILAVRHRRPLGDLFQRSRLRHHRQLLLAGLDAGESGPFELASLAMVALNSGREHEARHWLARARDDPCCPQALRQALAHWQARAARHTAAVRAYHAGGPLPDYALLT